MADQPPSPEPDLLDNAPAGAMCLGCRYDISGMDIRAKCPECGDRIAPSVNFIRIEYETPQVLQGLDAGTWQARRAGLVALTGLALLCAGYTLGSKGLAAQAALFATVVGAAFLLAASALAAQACSTITRHRISGEEQKLRTLRGALSIVSIASVAIAFLSATVLALVATGQIYPGRLGALSFLFILWLAFHFVPIYLIFYFQMLADRSNAMSAKVFLGLGVPGFAALVLMPTSLPGGRGQFALFGIQAPSVIPAPSFLPIDQAYIWPAALSVNIVLALVAIAIFRKGMNFSATSGDQPHEPPRS
jgi:hypothetical protein